MTANAVTANPRSVRVATRASELARWQADHVAALLRVLHDGLTVEIVPVSTEGDRRTDVPLSVIGGKGVFCKEIQAAVLDGRADIAVHSAKDLPALTPDGLTLAALPRRGDPRDALVGSDLSSLRLSVATGLDTVVATGSARRRVQLSALVPGLRFEELRGNMTTRLERSKDFDSIVVAAVALERLGLSAEVSELLDPEAMVPQVGQGALAVECRSDDQQLRDILDAVDDPETRTTVGAERAFLAELGGDCSLPAGAHATILGTGDGHKTAPGITEVRDAVLHIDGLLATEVDPGSPLVRESMSVSLDDGDPFELGRTLAGVLRQRLESR